MSLTEWWSIERDGKRGPWHRVEWDDERHADHASASMMRDDETINCIHRRTTPPETEQANHARTR